MHIVSYVFVSCVWATCVCMCACGLLAWVYAIDEVLLLEKIKMRIVPCVRKQKKLRVLFGFVCFFSSDQNVRFFVCFGHHLWANSDLLMSVGNRFSACVEVLLACARSCSPLDLRPFWEVRKSLKARETCRREQGRFVVLNNYRGGLFKCFVKLG